MGRETRSSRRPRGFSVGAEAAEEAELADPVDVETTLGFLQLSEEDDDKDEDEEEDEVVWSAHAVARK